MEEVIHYLELKNHYYEMFHSVTQKFLAQASQNRWDDLEFFVDNRDRILNIIRSYDFKIAQVFDDLDVTKVDLKVYRPRIKSLLDARQHWGQKILALDLELMSLLEESKNETIRELKRNLEAGQHMQTFAPVPTAKKVSRGV